jgi:hypothetical protein
MALPKGINELLEHTCVLAQPERRRRVDEVLGYFVPTRICKSRRMAFTAYKKALG